METDVVTCGREWHKFGSGKFMLDIRVGLFTQEVIGGILAVLGKRSQHQA